MADLRGKLEEALPIYIAAVKRLSQKAEEFDRRGCALWLDALVDRVRADHQRWQAARQQAGLLSKFTVALVDLALVAARQQPLPLPAAPPVLIAILANGEIRPALADEFSGRGDVVLLTREQFEGIAYRLRVGILQGEVSLNEERQASRLIHKLALALPAGEVRRNDSQRLLPG